MIFSIKNPFSVRFHLKYVDMTIFNLIGAHMVGFDIVVFGHGPVKFIRFDFHWSDLKDF